MYKIIFFRAQPLFLNYHNGRKNELNNGTKAFEMALLANACTSPPPYNKNPVRIPDVYVTPLLLYPWVQCTVYY